MTSSYTIHLRFEKSLLWTAYLKTSIFRARKRRLRVDGSRIRKYPATCERGLKTIIIINTFISQVQFKAPELMEK